VIQGKASGSLGGVLDFAVGSLLLASVCEVIAIPLGVGAAIYLSEYAAKNWLTSTIRYFIETLAGIPSVVIALVGAAIFVIALDLGYTLIGAGVSLAFMILPFNIRIAEEAMRSVPQGYREAAFALGATKWQTTRKTVLFAALPGIITGVLLGFGEALGETIVIALTAGWSPPTNLDLSGQVISNFTILPSAENLFATHQIFPSLSIFVWQATDLLRFGTGSSNLYFLQTGIVLTAAFYLVMIYLAICSTALIARNYLSKKIKGK
jgi:phosphate ABC transporter permease subunit PstA